MRKTNYNYWIVLIAVFCIIGLVSCASDRTVTPSPISTPAPQPKAPTATPTPAMPQEEYEIKTDPSGAKYIVDPDKIVGGGPPKDGIPSIDNPKFVPLDEADQWIEDN